MAALQIIHHLSLTWKIPLLKQFLHGVQKEQIFSLYLTSHVQGFHKQQHPFLHAECIYTPPIQSEKKTSNSVG